MKIVNLTPHTLNFYNGDKVVLSVEPSGLVARADQVRTPAGQLDADEITIPINTNTYGTVKNLPDPVDGTVYVVSALTAAAVHGRDDVFIVDDAVRDDANRVIGARALARV